MTLICLPADEAERARLRWERERERKRKARASWQSSTLTHHSSTAIKYQEYPFIMWDGEAPKDTGYSLFGSSEGHEICHPHLTTEECFDLLIQAKREHPQSIFFWFGGRYDSDEICRQSMPSDRLARLKRYGSVFWHGFTVKEAEGKFLIIKKDGVTVKLFEVFGWFHCKYTKALADYGIGTKAELKKLEEGKEKREEFLWEDIEYIKTYFRLELKLGPALMDHIRTIVLDAGFRPRNWYGPSALATELLTKHNIRKYMADCPSAVNTAAQYAYAAGRFEAFRGGICSPVYSYDENSAYMAAALDLPNLAAGEWQRTNTFVPGAFALYHIRYSANGINYPPAYPWPLWRRLKNGNIIWGPRVEGWYWSPEAELVKNDPAATFIEGYIFVEHSGIRPFSFVEEIFAKRLFLESLGDAHSKAIGWAFKTALAAIYGQLARRVGWNRFRRTAPRYHQLEWAGYITSKCRADQWNVAVQAGEKLISIDTDSVTAMCPLNVPLGKQLGEWKVTEADSGVFFQSGIYFTRKNGEWDAGKMRGIERGNKNREIAPQMLVQAIETGAKVILRPRQRYVTVRMALNGMWPKMGNWERHPGDELLFGGGGKRYHNNKTCERECNNGIHIFRLTLAALVGEPDGINRWGNYHSYPHRLPWKETSHDDMDDRSLINGWMWIDPEKIDKDDEWQLELIPS